MKRRGRMSRRSHGCFSALLALTTLLLGLAPPARADDGGVWANPLLVLDFKKPEEKRGFQLSLDFHGRAWGPNFLAILRPALGYDVGHGITLWLGYAFVPSFMTGVEDSLRLEHRIWEQFLITRKVGTVALQGRLRLEERFRQGTDGVGARLRFFGRAGFFFGHGSHWGWAVYDELLVQLNTTDAWNSGFDQNRAFTGPFFEADGGTRFEFGYMNYLVNRKDTGLYDSHIVVVNLFMPIGVFKKKQQPAQPAPTAQPVPEAPPGQPAVQNPSVGTDIVDPQ